MLKFMLFYFIMIVSLNANLIKVKEDESKIIKARALILNKKIENLKNLSEVEKLQNVNSIINNAVKYSSDDKLYKKKNYVATINEMLRVDLKGDCEDYVMAKLEILLYLGFNPENIKMLVVEKENVKHMKLLVMSSSSTIYTLDSLNKEFRVYNPDKNYKIYSSNGFVNIIKTRNI